MILEASQKVVFFWQSEMIIKVVGGMTPTMAIGIIQSVIKNAAGGFRRSCCSFILQSDIEARGKRQVKAYKL